MCPLIRQGSDKGIEFRQCDATEVTRRRLKLTGGPLLEMNLFQEKTHVSWLFPNGGSNKLGNCSIAAKRAYFAFMIV